MAKRDKIEIVVTGGKTIINIYKRRKDVYPCAEHIVTKKEAKWLVKSLAEML